MTAITGLAPGEGDLLARLRPVDRRSRSGRPGGSRADAGENQPMHLKPLALLTILFPLVAATPVAAADLQLTIDNPSPAAGQMYVALFDSAETMAANKPTKSQIAPITGNPTVVTFTGLSAGLYAFTVFADENGNGKLDTNFVGMPTERYGFSNDAMGLMGPPKFEAAQVRLDGETKATTIRLR
ncbi:DUF2141 domain-containing protein [Xylophilus sp. GOD-11R]|uniref:DUF2141 domain-containing protein n=1 Tax=Xylophilus sp. GOD-11R TaxID=3089814 RepID=UPI00298C69DE|nr:DUF2141 domain-containing protein [Xylophilus sp. GOD-11R]WPB55415.1 DUF2141 domain-containing protein [Xylophilus sp. GOD-11R]